MPPTSYEGSMYFEQGHCAHCNRLIEQPGPKTHVELRYLKEMLRLGETNFCSDDCYTRAIRAYLPKNAPPRDFDNPFSPDGWGWTDAELEYGRQHNAQHMAYLEKERQDYENSLPHYLEDRPIQVHRLPSRVHRDRCIGCGTPDNNTLLAVRETPYWFCSQDCIERTIDKLVHPAWSSATFSMFDDEEWYGYWKYIYEFQFKRIGRSRGYTVDVSQQLESNWLAEKNAARIEAFSKLEERVQAEARREAQLEQAKLDEQWHKEHAQQEARRLEQERWRPRPFNI